MRYVKLLSMMLGMALIATVVSAKECDSFGKGAPPVGATPPGISAGSGHVYGRQYVQPAPVVAPPPATAGRRAFSAEPAAAAAGAPATAAPRWSYRFYGGTDSSEPRVISGTVD
jgi:hypothetical protein